MDSKEIKEKAIAGSKWSIIEKFSLQIVQFCVGILLARLLGPEAFGLIALTSLFMTISGAITDGGFEKALIQNQQLTSLQISTAFYINLVLGIIMSLLVCVSSPSLASFFHAPGLTPILRVLSIGLPLDAFGQTQRMLLIKELHFKKIAVAQVCSALISGIVGVGLAFSGYGVWALVFSSLTSTFVGVIVFWYKPSWYPSFQFSYRSVAKMIPFGLNVLASSILLFTLQQFNNFIVGKYYSKSELGLFNRGMKFPDMVTSIIQGVVLKMSFPLFTKLQNDEDQLKRLLRKSNKIVAFISFPLLCFMFIEARDIVVFLLTDKWLGAVIFLKLFCFVKIFEPFISIQRELLLAQGKANLLLRLFLLTSVVEIIPILFLIKFGIIYVVYVSLASKMFQYVLYQILASNRIHVTLLDSLRWIFPNVVIIAIIAFCILVINFMLPTFVNNNLLLKLTADFLIGGTIYFVLGIQIKMEEWNTLKSVVYSFVKSSQQA